VSYTQEQTLYAALHENGLNDLFQAFFGVRGHYLEYGTPFYVPATTSAAMATHLPAIQIDLLPLFFLNIEYDLKFSIPAVDIFPVANPTALPPEIGTPVIGDFVIRTRLTFKSIINGSPLVSASVDVFGLCAPIVISSAPGTGAIGINLKKIEFVDLPQPLEDIAESVIFLILKFALAAVHIPFNTMTVGAFVFQLVAGPQANNHSLNIRGDVI
jgi:hypothetical protein